MHEPRHTEKKEEEKKNLLSCEQLQIAVYTAIAWSFPAGKQPSFRILQLFQQNIKPHKARPWKETHKTKED